MATTTTKRTAAKTRSVKGWKVVGGKRFYARSNWEGNYARYLQFLKEQGKIKDWDHEPKTFWFDGIRRGVCSYLPDFSVTNCDNSVEFHEVKGYFDSKSKTKIKRMTKYHPDVKLVVVDSKQYRAIAKTAKKLIPGWE